MMNYSKPVPTCGEHRQAREWRPTTFEYTEQDITVRIPNVYAWVCPIDGEVSFTPETVDALIVTVRELIAAAHRAKAQRSAYTEYWVSVGQRVAV